MEVPMTRIAVVPAAILVALSLAACASTGEGGTRSSADIITEQEIARATASNAYELIRNLRPRWLSTRGQGTLGTVERPGVDGPVTEMATTSIMVYLDGLRLGSVAALENVSTRDLTFAERLTVGEATRRFGGGHPHGAIVLTTK
jgi:hypothetical protein